MNVIDTATWRTIPTIDAALIRDSDPTGVWKEAVFQTPPTTTWGSRSPNIQPFNP